MATTKTTSKRVKTEDAQTIQALSEQLGHKSFGDTLSFLLELVRANNPALLPKPGTVDEVSPGQLPLIPDPPSKVEKPSPKISFEDDW